MGTRLNNHIIDIIKNKVSIILFLFFICVSCGTNNLFITDYKKVHYKTQKQINKLIKDNDKVYSLSLSKANFAYVWVNYENKYLDCYEIFPNKIVKFKVNLTNSALEVECDNYFQNYGYALCLDGGAILCVSFFNKNKNVEVNNISVDLQHFMLLNLQKDFCLEKQFQRDLSLIFSCRNIEKYMLK